MRYRPVIAACVALLLALSARAADPAANDRVEGMLGGMHRAFDELGEKVGPLSAAQQAKVAALEKKIGDKVRADPSELEKGAEFKTQVLSQFRQILTPDQQKKLDEIIGTSEQRRGTMITGANLRQVAVGALAYANNHDSAFPPDLGAVAAGDVSPAAFLAAHSAATAADAAKLDPKAKAAWVNANTDFVYLGAGQTTAKAGVTFVLAYVKPEVAARSGAGNTFLLADGRILTFDAEKSAKVLADLKAAKNPPPALDNEK